MIFRIQPLINVEFPSEKSQTDIGLDRSDKLPTDFSLVPEKTSSDFGSNIPPVGKFRHRPPSEPNLNRYRFRFKRRGRRLTCQRFNTQIPERYHYRKYCHPSNTVFSDSVPKCQRSLRQRRTSAAILLGLSSMNSKTQKRTNHALAKGLLLIALAVTGPMGCTKTETAADPRNLTPMVSIEGSDTMKPLLDDWSKQFMVEHPDIPVSVTIVDSGAGVKALVEKSTDIAASSRDLTNEENETVHTKGIHLVRRIVALDSIAIIVNPSLPLSEISMSDLRKVFTGKLTKWSELAPTLSGPITVCVREADSGTAQYFNDHVMQPTPSQNHEHTAPGFAKTAKVITSNNSLLETVAADKGAIGFIPLSNAADDLKTVKMLKVKLLDKSNAVMPSADATQDDYSLSRPLYMFFDSRSKPSTRKFVDFCTSAKGQEIVNGHGFVSLKK